MARYRMEFYLPRSLDGIVRKNRDLFEIGLATPDEIAEVIGQSDDDKPHRGLIDRWHLVAFRDRVLRMTSIHVLGNSDETRIRFTSDVSSIAPDMRRVITRNSTYARGKPAVEEPDLLRLLFVSAMVRQWGINEFYDLGVSSRAEGER